ncbi:MAG: ABC transporter ATP-binding protein [Roseateles sp.]
MRAPHTASSAPLLRLAGLRKRYPLGQHRIEALRGVDLEIREGEILALTGPSGSGKSSLLHIAGLIDADYQGQLEWQGRPLDGMGMHALTQLRRDALGFIFQGFNLVPVMSVADNVDFPLLLQGLTKAERAARVASMLADVGLEQHAAKRPDALSGGQRQRVAIARALVKQPRLIIADEPTASLDSHTATQVLQLLRERAKAQGAAVLMATHDARALLFCDRVLQLEDGRLQDARPADDTLNPARSEAAA